jgi:hypothetical protein
MRKNRSIYKIALASLFAFSCNKLIDIPDHPINQISETRVFSDSADIMSAVAGVYSNFKSTSIGGSLGSTMVTLYMGMSADELLYAYSTGTPYITNNLTANDANVGTLWTSGYTNIYQMNACINGISNTSAISDSLKRALVAEMKFTRAFYYFQLVNIFGGVPVVTSTDYKVTSKQPRGSVNEVYNLIQSDLAEAREVLLPKYPSTTRYRANKYTAMALSAKVFLYRQQWDSAAMMASEIINSGTYKLETTPNTVFQATSNETIWSLQINPTGTNYIFQTGEGYTLLPYSQYSTPAYTVNPLLLNAFEANDLRKTYWIRTATIFNTVYNMAQKYKNNNNTLEPRETYVMLRLADMYLVLAEAQANMGNYSDAITTLNIVRSRAGLSGYTGTNDDLLAGIYHERQIEMAFEWGNRWFDLKRTGTIDAVMGAEKTTWKPTAALFPIPVAQIIANSTLTQNDGY